VRRMRAHKTLALAPYGLGHAPHDGERHSFVIWQ
jgi:hypothetical protein